MSDMKVSTGNIKKDDLEMITQIFAVLPKTYDARNSNYVSEAARN
jgi:hypothetical protein